MTNRPLEPSELRRFADALDNLTPEPDLIVLRPAPGLDPDSLSARLNCWWYDRSQFRPAAFLFNLDGSMWMATPSGQFEVRDDGAVAEVWLVAED